MLKSYNHMFIQKSSYQSSLEDTLNWDKVLRDLAHVAGGCFKLFIKAEKKEGDRVLSFVHK